MCTFRLGDASVVKSRGCCRGRPLAVPSALLPWLSTDGGHVCLVTRFWSHALTWLCQLHRKPAASLYRARAAAAQPPLASGAQLLPPPCLEKTWGPSDLFKVTVQPCSVVIGQLTGEQGGLGSFSISCVPLLVCMPCVAFHLPLRMSCVPMWCCMCVSAC